MIHYLAVLEAEDPALERMNSRRLSIKFQYSRPHCFLRKSHAEAVKVEIQSINNSMQNLP